MSSLEQKRIETAEKFIDRMVTTINAAFERGQDRAEAAINPIGFNSVVLALAENVHTRDWVLFRTYQAHGQAGVHILAALISHVLDDDPFDLVPRDKRAELWGVVACAAWMGDDAATAGSAVAHAQTLGGSSLAGHVGLALEHGASMDWSDADIERVLTASKEAIAQM